MNILVRLPNWLGDMVMSIGFLRAVQETYPDDEIDVIVKKGLEGLVPFIEGVNGTYIFSREETKGLKGIVVFGRSIKSKKRYDLFFCLPDSFSSALMGKASGAELRVGYKKELRSILLTHSF